MNESKWDVTLTFQVENVSAFTALDAIAVAVEAARKRLPGAVLSDVWAHRKPDEDEEKET